MKHAQGADKDKKKDKGKGGIQVLFTQLDLTPEQQKKIDEFNKAHQGKYDQARKLRGDARKAKLREITVARNALLDELLTGEQQSKLKELKAAKKGKKEKQKISTPVDFLSGLVYSVSPVSESVRQSVRRLRRQW